MWNAETLDTFRCLCQLDQFFLFGQLLRRSAFNNSRLTRFPGPITVNCHLLERMSNLVPKQPDYSNNYSENGLWDKLAQFAKSAGRELVEKALVLFYAASDPDTPQRAKAIIFSALGYFILPLDAIPDITPLLGFSDDLGAIALALATVAAHIKPQHRLAAKEKTDKWFGESG